MRWLPLLLLLIVGCAPAQAAPAWGRVVTVGQAEQADAPALLPGNDRLTAAWIGADETGIHQDIRMFTAGTWSDRVVLPLPPVNPYDQQLTPASNGNLHLLWLDANGDGETRLYSALISPDLRVERGPVLVTDEPTLRYAVLPESGGAVQVISSGGLPYLPALYLRHIDARGRPRLQADYRLLADADWPALARTGDGVIYLFWLRPSDGQAMRGIFADGAVIEPEAVTSSMNLSPGDRLTGLNAALDQTHAYLFWNITRLSGQAESWFASGTPDTAKWSQPRRLGLADSDSDVVQTGFQPETAQSVGEGEDWLSHVFPLAGQSDLLPVAAQSASGLLVVYFQGRLPVAYQTAAPAVSLIGQPALLADGNGCLYLAWSQPNIAASADLNLASPCFSSPAGNTPGTK